MKIKSVAAMIWRFIGLGTILLAIPPILSGTVGFVRFANEYGPTAGTGNWWPLVSGFAPVVWLGAGFAFIWFSKSLGALTVKNL